MAPSSFKHTYSSKKKKNPVLLRPKSPPAILSNPRYGKGVRNLNCTILGVSKAGKVDMLKSWKLSNSPKTWNSPSPRRVVDLMRFFFSMGNDGFLKGRKVGINIYIYITRPKKNGDVYISYILNLFYVFGYFQGVPKFWDTTFWKRSTKKQLLTNSHHLPRYVNLKGRKPPAVKIFCSGFIAPENSPVEGTVVEIPIIYDKVFCYIPGGCLGCLNNQQYSKRNCDVGSHRLYKFLGLSDMVLVYKIYKGGKGQLKLWKSSRKRVSI